jgi:hypothetical protein
LVVTIGGKILLISRSIVSLMNPACSLRSPLF